MQIKELIIKNFKSFDFIKMPFSKGLHVVVGPNGSGKSNIIDALLFVFGATSLKKLRVDKLSNLINHHSKSKTAKVRCVLDNNGEEIEISREIDKDGKSIFSLNGKRKALHEIISYLNDLGIDTGGYNTVQQGDVTRIVGLNPEERRGIIDDISGISLFDARKKEAEINLKKVKERLDKVTIALNERKPYVEQLKDEKENAIKYKELETQESNLNYNLYKKQIDYYYQEINGSAKEVQEKEEKVNNIIYEKKKSEHKLKELEDKLEFVNSELISHSEKVQSTIGKQYSELNASKEIVQNNININTDNFNYLNSENEKASEVLSINKKEIKDVQGIIKNLKDKLSSRNKIRDDFRIKLTKNQKEYEQVKAMQEELYTQLSDYNKELVNKQDLYFEKKNRINAYNLQKEALENQDKEANQQLESLTSKNKELDRAILTLEKKLKDIESKLYSKQKELTKNKENKEDLDNKVNEIKIKLVGLKKDLSLSENIKNKKKEIKQILSKFKSFVGFLDDVVSLDSSQKAYFSSYVVLKDDSDVQQIMKKVNYNISFVVLSVLKVSKSELTKYFTKSFPITKTKLKISDFYFDGFCFKKLIFKDSKKLEKDILSLEKEQSSLLFKLEALSDKENKLVKDIDLLESEVNNIKVNLNTSVEIRKDVLQKLESINIQTNQVTLKKITSNVGQLNQELVKLDKEIKQNSKSKEGLEARLKKVNLGSHNTLRDEFDDIVSEINTLEQALISKSSEDRILFEKIESKSSYINNNNTKVKDLNKRLTALNDQKIIVDNKLLRINKNIKDEDSKKTNLFKQKSEINLKINDISQNMHTYDSDINNINMSMNNAKIMISTNQSKIVQIEQNLKFLDIKEKEVTILELLIEEMNSELRKVRREKNSLGNINFNAIDSYDKLAKEYDEILSKCEILEKEKEQVLSMLNEINMKKQTVFMDCFNKINKEFKNNVKSMSTLLSGELELVGEDALTSKLMINLTKNNKTKELDIMSGGEKTITALAFIFSLHTYKNAPFYILDEVDAALDDYNSLSLLNFIKILSKVTTILSISHNSTVVAGADQIIGVTLKEHTSVIGLNLT